jgi:hypothetical protein
MYRVFERIVFGAIAHSVEHLPCTQGVVGSIPTGSMKLRGQREGSVAQLVRAHP